MTHAVLVSGDFHQRNDDHIRILAGEVCACVNIEARDEIVKGTGERRYNCS